ncbi:MAG: carbohydrate kinase family protein [Candidatus Devosia symbiotica]|nr:carbohydrate kinase family protein [Candidatus Devosia symbiotica]
MDSIGAGDAFTAGFIAALVDSADESAASRASGDQKPICYTWNWATGFRQPGARSQSDVLADP